jgi:hypothetical protein
MSGFIQSKSTLILSNHKCGSSTVDSIFRKAYHIRGIATNSGEQFDFNPNSNHYTNLTSEPWKHASIEVWQKYLELKGFDLRKIKTVTTVRNPWDRLVSLFSYQSAYSTQFGDVSFSQFVECLYAQGDNAYKPFLNFIFDDNCKMKIDKVIKLEDFSTEIAKLCEELGEDRPINLTKVNATKRNTYPSYYSARTKDLVYKMFKTEVDYFNYEF